jgi:hypothetical protein
MRKEFKLWRFCFGYTKNSYYDAAEIYAQYYNMKKHYIKTICLSIRIE